MADQPLKPGTECIVLGVYVDHPQLRVGSVVVAGDVLVFPGDRVGRSDNCIVRAKELNQEIITETEIEMAFPGVPIVHPVRWLMPIKPDDIDFEKESERELELS